MIQDRPFLQWVTGQVGPTRDQSPCLSPVACFAGSLTRVPPLSRLSFFLITCHHGSGVRGLHASANPVDAAEIPTNRHGLLFFHTTPTRMRPHRLFKRFHDVLYFLRHYGLWSLLLPQTWCTAKFIFLLPVLTRFLPKKSMPYCSLDLLFYLFLNGHILQCTSS